MKWILFIIMIVVLFIAIIAILMIIYEYRQPGRTFPKVRNWWLRALFFNSLQVATVYLAGLTWDKWMMDSSHGHLRSLNDFWGSLITYFLITFVFYWWHRWRHSSPFLWRWLHQVHHSPQRLEIATAFYKHPFEFIADGLLTSFISFIILGISPSAAVGAILLSAFAELIYHWNVSTPRWLGYFFQRPESHCIHHQAGLHAYNYSDLPLWDMLFGTFRNPKTIKVGCGIGEDEHRIGALLAGKDLSSHERKHESYLPKSLKKILPAAFLLTIGLIQIGSDVCGLQKIKGVAAAWGASPCPKVFTTINGLETFSSRYFLSWKNKNRETVTIEITKNLAKQLKGPYNRRNVYGALLSYGPILKNLDGAKQLYSSIIDYALKNQKVLLQELNLSDEEIFEEIELITLPKRGSLA